MSYTLLLIILFLLEQGNTESCMQMIARTGRSPKVFSSPNFPNKFAEQTQCNWIVQAPSGYRVRIRFKEFYLIGKSSKKDSCIRQRITIQDMYNGVVDGPYCGNTPPPDIISSGQQVQIYLESNAVSVNVIYKGFQVVYWKTTELPTPRFRDAAGRWKQYRVARAGATLPPQTTPTPTRDPNEIDDNNNAEIDAVNGQVNRNANPQNVIINNNNNNPIQGVEIDNYYTGPTNFPPTRRPKPGRKRKKATPSLNIIYLRPVAPSPNTDTENGDSLATGAIVGIVVGLLIVLVISFIIIYHICLKPRKQKQSRSQPHMLPAAVRPGSRGSKAQIPQPHGGVNRKQRLPEPLRSSNNLQQHHRSRHRGDGNRQPSYLCVSDNQHQNYRAQNKVP